MIKLWTILLLVCALVHAQNSPAVLQIRAVQGEGAVYAAGSRATRGITVQVTDGTGKPVEGATLTFQLPASGATGTFNSGGKTESVTTGADGRAEVWGMQWNQTPGDFEMRVTAAKGEARGGTAIPLHISDAPVLTGSGSGTTNEPKASGGSKKMMWILIAAGAAAGVAVIGVAGKGSGSGGGAAPPPGPNPPQVGTPSITISRP